jgi:exodeoxyribonuclease X
MTARIRVFDLETTGFTPPDHAPCEIAYCDLVPGQADLASQPTDWQVELGGFWLCDPGRPIPPETSAIHHITDEDVAGRMIWLEIFDYVLSPYIGAQIVYAAHNARFERQWITDELSGGAPWICTYKCALRLWPDAPGHSNQTLRYWRKPAGLDRNTASVAHRAYPDAYVTAFLLRDMLELAPLEQLIEWSGQPALLTKIPFGDLRGQPWSAADEGLLMWILCKDFNEDIHHTAQIELKKRRDTSPSDRDAFDEDDVA